jgi:putative selenate reductase
VAVLVDGFDIAEQIIHVDGMCNECGNCATFCPHAGRPYKDKLTLFWSEEDFVDSENIGFLKLADDKYRIRDERGRVFDTALDDDELDKRMAKVIEAVNEKAPWLYNAACHKACCE